MRSKAHLKGHPIHPMLIPFPFTLLAGSAFFGLAARLTGRSALAQTSGHMQTAGLATAFVAAIPGFIDYLYTVPPSSSGKRRATQHLAANLTAVSLFALASIRNRRGAGTLGSMAELAGTALLSVGGWLGGTLVYRNQIGVDRRYADAGKWKELFVPLDGEEDAVVIGRTDELGIDQMKLLRVDGRRLVLARTAEGHVVFEDRCTHRGGSLAGGAIINGIVQCPWHGSQFSALQGGVHRGPAEDPVKTWKVQVRGEELTLPRDILEAKDSGSADSGERS
jgi:uncharacterized membrane protein/nitrite reductase/ring-hydroxylating ferredoxin subunit